ncbi:MAG: NACHT domain-containing protein [Burkholderiales bacterium]|nr:NACHT domain-containing protein [Burkholderiales bacterium]
MPIAETLILGAVKTVVLKLASLGADQAVRLFDLTGKKRAFNHSIARLQSIGNVKTLWQIDREISIYDFFVAPRASHLESEFDLTTFAKLPKVGNLVIEGILGQGKSIILRHMAISCMEDGLLPIFISAHTITKTKSLKEKIREYLSDFSKREVTNEETAKLLDSTFFVLLIDGFDEVNPTEEASLIEEVQSLSRRYDQSLRIIITSRPDNAIQKCTAFHIVKLCKLAPGEGNQLIQKLCDEHQARELISALEKSGASGTKKPTNYTAYGGNSCDCLQR